MTLYNIFVWIFVIVALGYGIFTACEDEKDKEIHTFLLIILNIAGFFLYAMGKDRVWANLIALIVVFGIFKIFDILHLWGSGDTKMAFEGLILSTIMLKPVSLAYAVFLFAVYMFLSSIIGLLSAIAKHDDHPPMGLSFLITNVIITLLSLLYNNTGGIN